MPQLRPFSEVPPFHPTHPPTCLIGGQDWSLQPPPQTSGILYKISRLMPHLNASKLTFSVQLPTHIWHILIWDSICIIRPDPLSGLSGPHGAEVGEGHDEVHGGSEGVGEGGNTERLRTCGDVWMLLSIWMVFWLVAAMLAAALPTWTEVGEGVLLWRCMLEWLGQWGRQCSKQIHR